jgi:hypothetical protein
MNLLYFTDNEGFRRLAPIALTIEKFMAQFSNYHFCVDEIIEKPKKTDL